MWVRSEYANELAVLSAWLSALVPWSVARHTRKDDVLEGTEFANFPLNLEPESSVFFLRFPLFELQLRRPEAINTGAISGNDTNITTNATLVKEIARDPSAILASDYPGTELFGNFFVTTPPTSASFGGYNSALQQASLVWTAAALVFAAAFALSIALYLREDAVAERLPVSPVHLMGSLLGLYALGAAAATAVHYTQRDAVGFPIPVGVVLIALLSVVLLQTEEIDNSGESDAGAE